MRGNARRNGRPSDRLKLQSYVYLAEL